jgi:glycosyltransferase involved in cell wall biosynthesis
VIPAHNEAGTITELIARVQAVDLGLITKEIIVVNDASTDTTAKVLHSLNDITVITHPNNRGKGGALKTGIQAATGDVVLFQDADLEYDPSDYPAMLSPLINDVAGWVNGVRIPPQDDIRRGTVLGVLNHLGNNVITWTTNVLYGYRATEYEGCYKAFPLSLLRETQIQTDDFDFDNELVCRLLKRGLLPAEVKIRYTPRSYAQGKHINWRHGLKILATIIRIRFSS